MKAGELFDMLTGKKPLRSSKDLLVVRLGERCPACGETLLGWRKYHDIRRCRLCNHEWKVAAEDA